MLKFSEREEAGPRKPFGQTGFFLKQDARSRGEMGCAGATQAER